MEENEEPVAFPEEVQIDEGNESAPTVNVEDETPAKVDSTDEAKADESTDVKVEDKPAEGDEPETADGETKEVEAKAKTTDDLLAEVDKEIANDKNSKYYRNGLDVFKKAFLEKTSAIENTYEPLKDYGDVATITDNLEIFKGLDSYEINPVTQLPEPTVKPFVDKLIEKKGIDAGIQVMLELGNAPSPTNQGWTLFHELLDSNGLDPRRIDDFKKFADNGYQMSNEAASAVDPEELELIPAEYREAYLNMSPEERDRISPTFDNDETDAAFRNKILDMAKRELESDRQKITDEKTQAEQSVLDRQQKERETYQAINVETDRLTTESGSRIYDSFTESLVSQAGFSSLDALNISNTMSFVLNGMGVEGERARAEIEKTLGISLDPAIDSIYKEWQLTATAVAAAKTAGNDTAVATAVNRFNDLEGQLMRKAKPVIAAFAKHQSDNVKNQVTTRNKQLTNTQTGNTGINPNEGQSATISTGRTPTRDFSEDAWSERPAFG